jgi:hypothetical protein
MNTSQPLNLSLIPSDQTLKKKIRVERKTCADREDVARIRKRTRGSRRESADRADNAHRSTRLRISSIQINSNPWSSNLNGRRSNASLSRVSLRPRC